MWRRGRPSPVKFRHSGILVALGPGIRLGAYEILSPRGRGGIGDVWRARDVKLQRDVAINRRHGYVEFDSDCGPARSAREESIDASASRRSASVWG